jgi:uracil-DNA glycosylase family 4
MGPYEIALRELCKLKGLNYVGTRGNVGAPVVFVGEAPGADEDATGYPFMGQAGKLADRLLSEAGFSVQDVWFTNPYKTRPPGNDISALESLGIPYANYQNQFFEEIETAKPAIIITAGATPLSVLCPGTRSKRTDEVGIGKWRGSLLTSPRLNWPHYVIPIFHPAYVLRDWSEKDTNLHFLRKIKEELDYWKTHGQLQPLPIRELIVEPDASTILDYLNECFKQVEPISIDIELLHRRVPYCISFARNPSSAISFSLWDYSPDISLLIWKAMDRIFRLHSQIGQNYTSFDAHWLYHLGFEINCSLVDDTRIRHNVLWPELSHKLEFMVAQYTREPYYKEEGRGWSHKDGKSQLQRYNCKDTACTYEVFNEQEIEFNERTNLKSFYYNHEKQLAANMFNIERRGVSVDTNKLEHLRRYITRHLQFDCKKISKLVGRPVAFDKKEADKLGKDTINLNSSIQVIDLLKKRGLKIPRSKQTGNESVGEEQLNNLFAATGDKVLKEILDVRELNKIKSTNVDCTLIDNVYYSVYLVGGTVGGRRSSKSNPLGFGGNGQNIPKHSKLGKKFRSCLVARPGKIFVQCDQVAAEDWIINGIIADQTGDDHAIKELQAGTDRHQKLASFIFGVPLDQCSRDANTIYRYVGKRTRYAGSYGMGGEKFAAVLAKEGFSIPKDHCSFILSKFHEYDPGIKGVFQAYVEKTLTDTRKLYDLFGRERDFFGLHPYRDNSSVFRDAYSYIPQSTVGDNNGASINFCETNRPGLVIMEVHDSIVLETNDSLSEVLNAVELLKNAYHRTLHFPKGYSLEIPIEVEIGYNLQDMTRCENLSTTGLQNTYLGLQPQVKVPLTTIGGVRAPLSQQA